MLIAVVGPTAAGKSDLGVELALAVNGEVINADSMQLYRGMDIGTAKLTAAERKGVPHHLLDVWDVTTPASVAEYQELADVAIADIEARGKVPVLVGGSGLYIRAALGDLEFPGTDEGIRERLEAELAVIGPAPLYARLKEADPVAAQAILPTNGRRIVRALEVIELSGRPFSATMPGYDAGRPAIQIGVQVDRPSSTAGSTRASTACGRPASMMRSGTWPRMACGTAGPPAARSATSRCSATSTASGPWTRHATRRPAPPGASPGARNPGSGETRASAGWRRATDWPPAPYQK
jgi:tRNA dimethylallyltransferase